MVKIVISLRRGEDFGHGLWWTRGKLLGTGGFGTVYQATSFCFSFVSRPDNMAVKSAKDSESESLYYEKEVFDQLRGCPDIIQCFGDELTTAEDGEKVYNLLLEYASGGTLSDMMEKSGDHGLCEGDVRSYARSIVSGLKHMHGLGYVHCDIKPENVLLVGDENKGYTAKIADLGLAKKSEFYGNNGRKKRKSQQEPCPWRGTLEFAAPEMVIEGVQEAPSDIWALGCVVLEMLTGKPAWGEDLTELKIADKIATKDELPVLPSDLSKEARSFLKLCLARNPNKRGRARTLLYHPFLNGGVDIHVPIIKAPAKRMRKDLNEVALTGKGMIDEYTIRPKKMKLC